MVPDAAVDQAKRNLIRLTDTLRIDAEPQVLVGDRPFEEILHTASQGADRVFLGMAVPDDHFQTYYETLQARTAHLPSTVLVLAAPRFAFTHVLME